MTARLTDIQLFCSLSDGEKHEEIRTIGRLDRSNFLLYICVLSCSMDFPKNV